MSRNNTAKEMNYGEPDSNKFGQNQNLNGKSKMDCITLNTPWSWDEL